MTSSPVKDKSTLGVKAIDDHTFQVTLSEPVPYLVEMTPHYAMKPVYKDAVEVWRSGRCRPTTSATALTN